MAECRVLDFIDLGRNGGFIGERDIFDWDVDIPTEVRDQYFIAAQKQQNVSGEKVLKVLKILCWIMIRYWPL